ncbi:hypothetical protein [Pedobacter frigidisoli]|uniref:hypothetical protein n=1 Tax=Pedobacter frigidisoli TaxID=2530455 RepID=UPI00293085B5|nr:hypothetical protein [Pedobacter frigidisoli]
MKNNSVLIGCVLCVLCFVFSGAVYAQRKALNIAGIHQLVADSKSENERQQTARNRQAQNTVNEQVNKTLLFKLKDAYRLLNSRFSFLGMAVSAAEVGLNASPMVTQIIADQSRLYDAAVGDPLLLPLVYQTEVEFVLRAKDLSGYLLGLVLSYGALNQMKISDRKMLFDHVIAELQVIAGLSAGLVRLLNQAKLSSILTQVNPFADYISTDKSVVEDILKNAKALGL